MSYDKEKLSQHLKTIYEHTSTDIAGSREKTARFLGGSGTSVEIKSGDHTIRGKVPEGQGPSLAILLEGREAFDAFIDECMKDDEFAATVGRAAVKGALDDLLRSTKGECPADVEIVVKAQILKPLKAAIRPFRAYLPVVNLAAAAPLSLGNVELISTLAVKSDAMPILERYKFGGDETEQGSQRATMLAVFNSGFEGYRGFARVSGRAHPKFADDLAIDQALVALNVLRSYSLLFAHKTTSAPKFGLPTEVHIGRWGFAVFRGEGEKIGFSLPQLSIELPIPFILNDENCKHLKESCHLDLLHDLLLKGSKRNSLERAIVQAFQALGRATLAPTLDMRLLGATIALERILFSDGETNTTERFVDRLALGFAEGPKAKAIARLAKRIYGLRSDIVHAAWCGATEEDVVTMDLWAINAILLTLQVHKNFGTHNEYCQHLQDKRYPAEVSASDKSPEAI